jgi:hypothetical protein
LVNALVFNGKAVVERRGFRPKIFDDLLTVNLVKTLLSLDRLPIVLIDTPVAKSEGFLVQRVHLN